jgi:organic hydroperoxide reductase OsmC/OhrA
VVEGLEGIDSGQLQEIAKSTEQGCTISIAILGAVAITVEVVTA